MRPNGRSLINLRISGNIIISILSLFLITSIAIGTTLYFSMNAGFKLKAYESLKNKYDSQSIALDQYNLQIRDLSDEISLLQDKELEIRSLLGERVKKKNKKISASKNGISLTTELGATPKQKSNQIQTNIVKLESHISSLKSSLSGLSQKTTQYKHRFASTPSIWPVFGRIRSHFGWRNHPITKKRTQHKGIDIPSWQGAPIRATADGVVTYAGWSKTYGYLTIIDHKYGYMTIYAHSSRLLVEKGEFVKKGRHIAQIGSTGLSTGSHLHYEIRRWRKAIPPKAYLDLDMFTASNRMW
ncbi:peptidoglycan DD-metalloendopeptidase family protein [bacterium]|jgi:murein DD-endopeptidase MepM/ murein hydrolase activator NlpD|nr:peptidoglycan DD-metalloendopeptidase family protein [bacterium]